MSRVLKTVLSLDPDKVIDFFEQRARKYSDDSPYGAILYQDKNPQVAFHRDQHEKSLITPL